MWDHSEGNLSHVERQRRHKAAADKKRAERDEALRMGRSLLRKIRAQVRIPGQSGDGAPAWATVSDLSERSGEFFCTDKIPLMEDVSVILEARDTIYLRGRVVGVYEVATTGVVRSVRRYRYRVLVAFLYESPSEKDSVVEYIAQAAA